MIAPPVPENVRALLERLPVWFPQAVAWSVQLANHGPVWLPRTLRNAPLGCLARVVRVVVKTAPEAPGYGGTPWKAPCSTPCPGTKLDAGKPLQATPERLARHVGKS